MKNDAITIIKNSIKKSLPDEAVKATLESKLSQGDFDKRRLYLVAIGKAGWQMANAASSVLDGLIHSGIVITKYGHVFGELPNIKCFEAGHPIPDSNTFIATKEAIRLVSDLTENDTVLFLVSGGGSALFEKPLIDESELFDITNQLLSCGAYISEINTIRKRLSSVKAGRFANICAPAKVLSIVLSDIVGNPLDMIASGPAYPDSTTCDDAIGIISKYNLRLSSEAMIYMDIDTPKSLSNVETIITGSVNKLCLDVAEECRALGYEPFILTNELCCEAREAGSFLASIARTHKEEHNLAFIAGGETVVHITGQGKGGRNQEIALSAAEKIAGLENVAIFSVGSDGTDGPTDAAGGYADGHTKAALGRLGTDIYNVLLDNDSYNALKSVDGLIVTGPTGTNVNDVSVVLIR